MYSKSALVFEDLAAPEMDFEVGSESAEGEDGDGTKFII